jgi:hypothetical protein
MPYVYQDRVRGEPRSAFSVPSSTGEVLTETFAQAYEENPIKAVRRFFELSEDQRTGPRLTAEQARKRLADAGMDEIVVGDAGITNAALLTLMDRKRIERRRQEVFAMAEGGVGQTAARFGIAAATTLVDPLSAGLNFVPIVGQARYARWLAGARGLGGRVAVRAGVGTAEGAAGAAIAEVPIYAMRRQEQADYDMGNSLLNVAFGGVIGSGLHVTVGSTADLLVRRRQPAADATVRAVDGMSSDAQQAALRAAVGQAATGQAIDVAPIVRAADAMGEADPLLRRLRTDDELRATLEGMRNETGWAQVGGRVIREGQQTPGGLVGDGQGDVVGRTEWIPRAEWWPSRPKGLNEDQVHTAVDKALRGAPLTKREREMIEFMSDVADERNRLEPYLPTMDELAADGLRGADDAYEAALVARAAEIDESAVERLAVRYDDDADGFLREIKKLVDENATAAAGGAARQGETLGRSLAEPDQELEAALTAADETLLRDVDPTIEANLKAANDEAALAEADAKLLADRLGVKYDTAEMAELDEYMKTAERWALAAELATVCLVRGG